MSPIDRLEDELVEEPSHEIFRELDYEALIGSDLDSERNLDDVVLTSRLSKKIRDLNPNLPEKVYQTAISKVISLKNTTIMENNQEFQEMLLAGVKVIHQGENRKEPYAVKLIDFQTVTNNDFTAVRQMSFKKNETTKGIRTDHILFVNGLPLVILEYKSPTEKITEAYTQIGKTDYQKKIPKLFNYNAFNVISNRTIAKYGTMSADLQWFSDFNDPANPDNKPTNRLEIMLQLLLNKETLLKVVQNFVAYEKDNKGHLIKKIAGQHQIQAVDAAVEKTISLFPQKDENREWVKKIGVIWHTTRSGKSFTMMLYANIISKIKEFNNPTFVVITDRVDLDEQLGGFWRKAGFPYKKPKKAIQTADSVPDLREKLSIPGGKVIFTTIQKFQTTKDEKDAKIKYPIISDRRNIILIVDECHRTQYQNLAINLSRALPNALKIGFSGTPIEKENSTSYVFGENLHTYKIKDAVRDERVKEIICESRLVKLHIVNKMLDSEYEEIAKNLDPDAKGILTGKYSKLKILMEDKNRLQTISENIVFDFLAKQKLWKGKAMLAASTKLAAARYADIISGIDGAPKCTCIISDGNEKITDKTSDENKSRYDEVSAHYKTKNEIDQTIEDYIDPKNDLKLLIVCDKYLTGFDSPITYIMYVDKPLKDHNLIQAISRTSTLYKEKPNGIIIDYIGIAENYQRALGIYNAGEVKGVMDPSAINEIIKKMENIHLELINFFVDDIGNGKTYNERKKGPYIDNALNEILADEAETRQNFIKKVSQLTKAFAVCTPNIACQEVEDDLRFFQVVRKILQNSTVGAYVSPEIEGKVQDLVEKSISSDENIKHFEISNEPEKVNISEKLKEIKQISQKNLKMELAYKLLDDAITVRFKGNVVKQKNFREEIEKTISKYHGTFENYESVFPLFEEVAQKIEKQVQRGEQLQMSDEEIAFYDILKMGKEYLDSDKIAQDIARNVVKYLKKNLKIDWVNQQNVHDAISVGITKILLKEEFPIDKIDEVIPVIMQQTENNYSDFGMQ